VAGGTTHLVAGVSAPDAASMGRRVQVALETDPVGGHGRQFRRISDVRGIHGLGVLGAGAVTGLARPLGPAAPGIVFQRGVGILLEGAKDILVAGLTGLGAGILARGPLDTNRSRQPQQEQGQAERPAPSEV